jgi:hypothetical protein
MKGAEAAASRAIEEFNARLAAGLKAADEAVSRLTDQTDSQIRSAAEAIAAQLEANLRQAEAAAGTARKRLDTGIAEAIGAAETGMARLAEQAEAARSAAEEATRQAVAWQEGAAQGAGSAGAALLEGMTEARHEMSAFIGERIRQDIETQTELLGCRSLEDLRDVQVRFFRGAVDQYSAEVARMMRLGTEIVQRTIAR